jgi:hypothetical protein
MISAGGIESMGIERELAQPELARERLKQT